MMARGRTWLYLSVSAVIILLLVGGCARLKKEEKLTPEQQAAQQQQVAREAEEKREFEKGLTAKKYPGIEGEVLESPQLKDINFDFDRYDLTDLARRILAENAAVLTKHPNIKIQIEGHCDERGSNEYNLALGERRAATAKNYLIKLGIQADRLSTISYGEEMPLDSRHTEEAWAKNRRCHFVILSR